MDEIEQMISDFQANRGRYVSFTEHAKQRLISMTAGSNIEYLAIESRTKDPDSFEKKLVRPDKVEDGKYKYKKYTDVTDLSGVRIIAYYQKDADAICQIIEDSHEIDRKRQADPIWRGLR
ncbi:hypothetical protein [Mesorhizobium sp. M1272]|uniref:hypothetical protein n=1 Tax=Mesorhizobium sp. M1272 TaxID=2957074 RepID=UPI003336BAF9